MKIKVIRDYSGEEGAAPDYDVLAGTEHTVTRARGNALHANGLVEILSDEADPEEVPEATAQEQEEGDVAQSEPIQTKDAPPPPNKDAPKPRNKAAGK